MSNLQILARRCPIMGKAMAVQTAKTGHPGLCGAFGGVRAYGGKAKLHTTRYNYATVDNDTVPHKINGIDQSINYLHTLCS